jgi:hypothetical protein
MEVVAAVDLGKGDGWVMDYEIPGCMFRRSGLKVINGGVLLCVGRLS